MYIDVFIIIVIFHFNLIYKLKMKNTCPVSENQEAYAHYTKLLSLFEKFIKSPSPTVDIPKDLFELNKNINIMINTNKLPQLVLKEVFDLNLSYQAIGYMNVFLNTVDQYYADEKNLEKKETFYLIMKFLNFYTKNFLLQNKIDTSEYSNKLPITRVILFLALQRVNKCAYMVALSNSLLMSHKHIVIAIFKTYYKIDSFCNDFLLAMENINIEFNLDDLLEMLRYIQHYQSNKQNKEIVIPLSKFILTKVNTEKQSNEYLEIIKVLKRCLFQTVDGFLEEIHIRMFDCIMKEEANSDILRELILLSPSIVCPVLEERHINYIIDHFKIESNGNFFVKILSSSPQYINTVVHANHKNDSARLVSLLIKNNIPITDKSIIKKLKYYQKYGFCMHKYKEYSNINFNLVLDFGYDDEEIFNILLSIILKEERNIKHLIKMLSESYYRTISISIPNYKVLSSKYLDTILKSYSIQNRLIESDEFKPYSANSFTIDSNKTEVIMIDKSNYMIHFELMKGSLWTSLCVGIDTEWKSSTNAFDPLCPVSIIQLSSFDEKFIFIIDIYTGVNDQNYMKIMTELMKRSKFVGFGFNSSDMKILPMIISSAFQDNIVDIQDIYREKVDKKVTTVPSLKNTVKEILNLNMCKVEQCSNWNRRPLRKAQMHYAAVDALMCVKLYKALNNI